MCGVSAVNRQKLHRTYSESEELAGFSLLHSFAGGSNDGSKPYGSLIQSGSTLYGISSGGGNANAGTIFKIESNGSGFSVLHSFTGGSNDGSKPYGSLIQSGSTLYGISSGGGNADDGTVFKIGTDGTGFSLLHSFVGGSNDGLPGGLSPNSMILSGSTLFGMTQFGGGNRPRLGHRLPKLKRMALGLAYCIHLQAL